MTYGQLGPVSGAQPGKIGDIAQATLILVQHKPANRVGSHTDAAQIESPFETAHGLRYTGGQARARPAIVSDLPRGWPFTKDSRPSKSVEPAVR